MLRSQSTIACCSFNFLPHFSKNGVADIFRSSSSWPFSCLLFPHLLCSRWVEVAAFHSPCSCSPAGSGGWSLSSGPTRGAPIDHWSCTALCRPCHHTRDLRKKSMEGIRICVFIQSNSEPLMSSLSGDHQYDLNAPVQNGMATHPSCLDTAVCIPKCQQINMMVSNRLIVFAKALGNLIL